MTEELKIGDFVAIGSTIGLIVGVKQFYSGRRCGGSINPIARRRIELNPDPRIFEVRFAKYKSDQFFEEECSRLTGKEVFKAKLSGDFDELLQQ